MDNKDLLIASAAQLYSMGIDLEAARRRGIAVRNVAGYSTDSGEILIFNDDTKVGEISEIYACGNNDHLLVVILDGKNDGKFRSLESMKDMLQADVLRDKKASILMERLAKATDVASAAKVGEVTIDTIKHVTFSSPVFVSSVGSSEFALSGAVAKAKKGQFVNAVKGLMGVYSFQVTDEKQPEKKMDETAKGVAREQVTNSQLRAASRFMQELFERANVKDNRYIFY